MNDDIDIPQLFRHSRRPSWGLAICAWKGDTRRRYQFQDGRLRTFKKGFYHLFEPVDKPLDIAEEITAKLESELDISRARKEKLEKARERGRTIIPFKKQVAAFRHLYPGTFEDPAYISDVRGTHVKKRRKRHRDPAIAHAQEMLAKERLERLLDANAYGLVRDAVYEVGKATDLCRPTELKPLQALEGSALEAYAEAVYEQLWSEDDNKLVDRVEAVVKALERTEERVTWPLVTVPMMLVRPDDYIAVKPSVFREQARWMAPRLKFDMSPNGKQYRRLLGMSFTARRRMQQQGLDPHDMVDVHQFIWETLRPTGKKLIATLD